MRANDVRTAAEALVDTCLQLAADKTKFELDITLNDVVFETIQELQRRCANTTLDLACRQ